MILLSCFFVASYANAGSCPILIKEVDSKLATAKELSEKHSREIYGFSVDVSNKESVKLLKNKILKKTKKINGLVNAHQNKSHLIFEKFEELNEEMIHACLAFAADKEHKLQFTN